MKFPPFADEVRGVVGGMAEEVQGMRWDRGKSEGAGVVRCHRDGSTLTDASASLEFVHGDFERRLLMSSIVTEVMPSSSLARLSVMSQRSDFSWLEL